MPKSHFPARRTQFFSNTLLLLMERNSVSQVEAAAASGIACSRINNYLKGKYRTIRPDHLASLAQAVGRSTEERAELARAYLLDLLPEALHRIVRIQVEGSSGVPAGSGRDSRSPLPPTAADAITQLQSLCLRNARARARMQWFVEILREVHRM
jgi:transcriptional regulator with XRE-family HTH domain